MKRFFALLFAFCAFLLTCVPVYGAESTPNPSTGDNSMVTLALIIMAIAAVVMVVLLFVTRKKK